MSPAIGFAVPRAVPARRICPACNGAKLAWASGEGRPVLCWECLGSGETRMERLGEPSASVGEGGRVA